VFVIFNAKEIGAKAAREMLMTSSSVVNFIIILSQLFANILLTKNTNTNCEYRKAVYNTVIKTDFEMLV